MSPRTHRAVPLAILVLTALYACGDDVSLRRSPAGEGVVASKLAVPAQADEMRATDAIAAAPSASRDAAGSTATLPNAAATQTSVTTSSMIIRTGTAMVEVDSLELAVAAVQRIATSLGGWVGNTSLSAGTNEVRSATIELKVPSARYEDALAGLKPIGKVESVNSTAEDVGEEFVDLTARTANARRLEERLITLLATRTGKLEDVLNVERELARVREEIERYDGRLRYLRTRVATSTLSVTVHERAPLVSATPGESVIGEAFKDAWRNFVHFVAALIASLGTVIPLLIVGLVAALGLRRFVLPLFARRPKADDPK